MPLAAAPRVEKQHTDAPAPQKPEKMPLAGNNKQRMALTKIINAEHGFWHFTIKKHLKGIK